jgi:uncharacterized protein
MRAGTISSSVRFKGHLQGHLGDWHYAQRWSLMMATKTSNRGFASMDEEKQREIDRKGGESVPDEKRSFSKDHELASEAGPKGGQSVPDEKRSFSKDHELASEAGRKGGETSHKR